MNFVHLRTSTEFSITQGTNRVDTLVEKVANDNMGAVAITDLNGMFGSVSFYKEARKKGLKPIIGVDITVEQEEGNTYQLVLLAKNANGYKKLIQLNSRGYTQNRKENSVAVKEEWLADLEDVIVLSGGKQGLIGQSLLAGDFEGAKEVAGQMKDFFGDDFYIELQRDGTPEETVYMDGSVQICADLGIAPVATHPCFFTEQDDFFAHETRYCIANKKALFDIKRARPFNKEMYLKNQNEMTELFSDLPQALENSVTIAKKCNIDLELDKPNLPIFTTPDGENVGDYFEKIAKAGLEERLRDDYPNPIERDQKRPEYEARLQVEVDIIKKMDFPSYFLIVSDFITWAKDHDIPVGPGRGSGAGSLVAYSMKITDLDPLPYGLLFERFLNPDRVSMPDFDIDFCQERRGEVYEYVRQKYGEDAVSHIGTFGTMAAKAVIRDVGRSLGFPYDFCDNLAKMVNIPANKPIKLKQFIFGDEESGILPDEKMLKRYDEEADVKKLVDIALKIEGVTRQVGTHAAGVVIAPTVLTDYTPLYTPDANGDVTTQFDGGDVEKSGLVKFDFLGLTTLTILKNAIDLINARKSEAGEESLNLRKIPLDDLDVYNSIFGNGNTVGVFQFESQGMTNVLKKAQPQRLEDLIAINALYRPGPMDIIPDWLVSKNTPEDQRVYPDDKLKDVLKETYGFMIYQEQVMQCAQVIAGYSLGGADILRRAMGKKKVQEMKEQRENFIKGAKENGVSEEKANSLFDLIDKFSGYGFNKSHAAAYSYLAYQTAYLKHHYPEEFLVANLNVNVPKLNVDKIAVQFADATNKNGMKINPPDVNHSFALFTVEGEKTIRYGLEALKGVGNKAGQVIVEEREKNGPYTDFYNFLERVGKGAVNKRVMEALVRAGAFDSIHPNRAQLYDAIAPGLDYVAKFRKKQLENVSVMGGNLFDDEQPAEPVIKRKRASTKKPVELIRPELTEVEAWDELTVLKNEKISFGYFYSSNPYSSYYSKKLGGFPVATPISQIEEGFENGQRDFFIGCLVEEIRWWKEKGGAFVTISDGIGTMDLRVFSSFLNDNKDWFKNDGFAAIRLKADIKYDDEGNEQKLFTLVQGFNFDQTMKLTANKLFVGAEDTPENLAAFDKLSNEFHGTPEDKDTQAILCLPSVQDPSRRTRKAKSNYVKVEPKLVEELVNTFGEPWVKMSFKENLDNVVFPELPSKKGNNKGNSKNYNKSYGKKSAVSF